MSAFFIFTFLHCPFSSGFCSQLLDQHLSHRSWMLCVPSTAHWKRSLLSDGLDLLFLKKKCTHFSILFKIPRQSLPVTDCCSTPGMTNTVKTLSTMLGKTSNVKAWSSASNISAVIPQPTSQDSARPCGVLMHLLYLCLIADAHFSNTTGGSEVW